MTVGIKSQVKGAFLSDFRSQLDSLKAPVRSSIT